ncbi:MAG: hypothetical protein HY907_03465 [Deltaproteobacteria bacterium]|nr:hypothetical protein [Deltaproteobacteria bacterium]
MVGRGRAAAAAAAGIVLWAAAAAADDLDLGGMVSTDFRVAITGPDQSDLTWNLNIGELNLKQRLNPHIRYELDLRVMFDGLAFADDLHTLDDLTNSLSLDPFWIESDAAYVAIRDIFEGFDILFGRQIVTWGASDRFRPTNNLNPDDVWDPTRFGMTQANEMVRFVYNPVGDLVFEAVVVPIFRPARLPDSATAALADPHSVLPLLEDDLVHDIEEQRDQLELLGFGFATETSVQPPDVALENLQVGARVSWRGFESDWSLSYYYGFDDFPHPVSSVPEIVPGTRCDGTPVPTGEMGGCVNTAVGLAYPRIHVAGFDIAGQIEFLDDAGYRIEGAVVWPERTEFTAALPTGELRGTVVDGRPFFKATLGIDYTFTRDIFALAMLVHGMVDELGPQFVGDYAVVGADFKFFNSKLLLRLFAIAALDLDHPAGVIYPLLNWNPWSSMELEAGALIFLGDDRSKFGQPAAGESTVFLRSRVRF